MKKFVDGLPETPGIVRRRRNKIGVVLFSGCQDELVVLVAQRLERGQSRVGAFPEVIRKLMRLRPIAPSLDVGGRCNKHRGVGRWPLAMIKECVVVSNC